MHWFFSVSALPAWFIILVLLAATILATLAPFFVRRRVSLERLVLNNEVAGFKYATLGVIYAVLLGFAVITVWEMFEAAEDGVIEETAVLDAMYRLGQQLPAEVGAPILADLRAYMDAVVADEWPAMAAGAGASERVNAAIGRLYVHYLELDPASDVTLRDTSIDLVIRLNVLRRERLDNAEGTLPAVLGVALIVGALLVVGFMLFFGAANVVAQAAMTGVLCSMVMLVLFAAVMLNHPFSGDVRVSSRPLEELRAQIAAGEVDLRPAGQ